MEQYLIPANSKKSQLIFGVFQPIDLVIMVIGIFLSLILMLLIPGETVIMLCIKMIPMAVGLLLVMPIAFYHNVRVFLIEAYIFYFERPRRYYWRGWCATYGFDENK
ncbi:MAG: hypothetical protein IJ966_06320 [Bacilli bacterium]|jgi:hypothetical protein|nr:hypothetical protein [Bacilli bacterium]